MTGDPVEEPGGGPAAGRPGESYSCPSCGQLVWPDDNFCESCRAELSPTLVSGEPTAGPAGCPSCPGAPVGAEGYCESCGRKVPSGTDHAKLDLGLVAGVTDRGLRHRRNEDAMALATVQAPDGPAVVAVVCDGISTSSRPDEASQAAAHAAVHVLVPAARAGSDLPAACGLAFKAAQQALIELAGEAGQPGASGASGLPGQFGEVNVPATTFVAAVLTSQQVTVCWIGDSRAYWLDGADEIAGQDGADTRQLTSDDSMARELVDEGLLTASQALASPAGHIVTGWIGADLGDATPHVVTFAPGGPGVVLLCSDGLWNYRPAAADLAASAMPTALADPLGTAAALVRFAIEAGGSDNITAVLAPFPPRGTIQQANQGEQAHEPA